MTTTITIGHTVAGSRESDIKWRQHLAACIRRSRQYEQTAYQLDRQRLLEAKYAELGTVHGLPTEVK